MRRVLVERRLHHRRRHALPSDLDLELGAFLREMRREIARPDRRAKRRAHRAAADGAARAVIREHRIAMTRDVAVAQREADELLGETAGLLRIEHVTSDELTLLELDQP